MSQAVKLGARRRPWIPDLFVCRSTFPMRAPATVNADNQMPILPAHRTSNQDSLVPDPHAAQTLLRARPPDYRPAECFRSVISIPE
jgi:hypothetical protein